MTSIGMKVYDLAWFHHYKGDLKRAAGALRADGVDTVLTQNQIDPLPASGVEQNQSAGGYSDTKWVEALRQEGLTVLQTTATFFDPDALIQFPDARPINALGKPDAGFDWYTGVCPTHEEFLQWKCDKLHRVVQELSPDGLFLQFTRWPGFWENWTWSPDYSFTESDEYCFCDRCRHQFSEDLGIDLGRGDLVGQASLILDQHRLSWIDWKSRTLYSAIERIASRSKIQDRDLTLMLNTLPFPPSDFDDLDVRRSVCGQDLTLLEGVIDRFELMTYLQILNRPPDWIEAAVTGARDLTSQNAEVVCTLQASPLYTEGMHAARQRSDSISASDLEKAASIALDSGVNGLVFYHWGDFLTDESAGGKKRTALRRISRLSKEIV